jgi:hypothetical protein
MASVKYTLKSGTEDVTGVTINSWFDIMAERNNIIRNITIDGAPTMEMSEQITDDAGELINNDVSQLKVTTISLQDQIDVISSSITGSTIEIKAGSVDIDDFANAEGRYQYTVSFEPAYATTNYAVSINYSTSSAGFIMTSYGSKTVSGFTIYVSGLINSGEQIDWVTIPY